MTDSPADPPCALEPFARARLIVAWPEAPQRAAGALTSSNRGWRTRRPEIALATCNRCGLCFLYCPDAAIVHDESGYPMVAADWCKGCGLCAAECPKLLISLRDEAPQEPRPEPPTEEGT